MTEKQRFEYDYKTGRIYDNESDWQGTKNPLHWVTRLNNFNEQYNKLKGENEKLKQDLSEYCNFSLHDILDKKNKEIEQLQKKNDNLVHMIARVQYRADTIKDENEQLKKVFRELITSGYWDDDYLTEQDWNDLKRWIENVFEKVMMND